MNQSSRLSWWSIRLVLICTVIFILQIIFKSITNNFVLVSHLVLERPWTLLTHAFLHGSASHLLYNMFALAIFGTILEGIIGSKQFLILYISAGIASAIACIPLYGASLGASGAIFGVLGMLAVLRPKMIVWVFGFPMPMALAAVFWGIGDFVGLFVPSGTANAAHLAGLAVGLGFGFYFYKKFKKQDHKKRNDIRISEENFEQFERKWM